MWLDETFDLKYPLLQGGMAWVATAEFAAAVSEAGALGQIASGSMTADMVRASIRRARELTDRPFGVNLMLMNPEADAIARVLVEERVPLVTTGAGSPGKYIAMWKEAGSIVIPVVSSLLLAQRMERQGADAVIAEGQEAGGHIGEQTSMVLWPLVAENLSIPMIAAGGIGSPRQIKAAIALGAEGFQLGTLFLSAEECPIHPAYKEAVIKATDTQISVMGRVGGVPCRVLKNKFCRDYMSLEREGAEKEVLEEMLGGSLRQAVQEGNSEKGAFMMGLVAAGIKEIKPLDLLLADLFEGVDA
ncbi:MAG: enoyl-[acyl-carrier-protein] reductase FabK [Clostridiaceae bacterium]|jgi:enoyl-[acyl-carrier protein] reductase II|nr:enoyl-[acyl-carrier-protein] reductase FabK [Clostridiaceae bacterium]